MEFKFDIDSDYVSVQTPTKEIELKYKKQSLSPDFFNNPPNLSLIITDLDLNKPHLKHLFPHFHRKAIEAVSGPVISIDKLKNGGFFIQCKSSDQFKKLLQIKFIAGFPVKVFESQPRTVGVVFGNVDPQIFTWLSIVYS